ncbi:MAG: putative DNA binding domain-containing protein [Bacteroidales bacterium]|nr:putative DNA binding domain-containing protein [Bacteroidales bacterium]
MNFLDQLNIKSLKEGNRLEAKLAKGGIPGSLWETYSSFANTEGGLILLGVKENKNHTFSIEGLENPEQLEKTFWDCVNNKKNVNINILSNSNVEIKEIEGKYIMAIDVPRAERIYRPVFKGQDMFTGTYRRNGEGDYLCSRDEVAAIFRDAGQITQDNKIITEVSLDTLCKETIAHYRQRFVLCHNGHIWNSLTDTDFLKKIGAAKINREDGKVYPTAAGLLMFGYEPEILYEYPLYFLDYQEHFDETTRWSDRIVSSSGEWSGNIFDFFFKVFNKLTEDVKKPFALDGITRIDDTPTHKAIREILLNALANADYYGRCGVVIKKYKDRFTFENPGTFRISLKEAIDGGMSDPRNATILKMFSMIDIGERAGSGIPGVFSVWNKEFGAAPEYTQRVSPDRIITELKIADFWLKTEGEKNKKYTIGNDENGINMVSEPSFDQIRLQDCPDITHELPRDYPKFAQRTQQNCPEKAAKLPRESNKTAQRKQQNCPEITYKLPREVPKIAQRTYLAIAENPYATIAKLSETLGISPRTVKNHIALLRDKFIKRIGSDTKGHWEIIEQSNK